MPVFILVVQTDPGPIPTLTISAPASINSWVISAVTTLPAAIVASGHLSLNFFTASTKRMVYPFATSRPMKPFLIFDKCLMSSIPPNQQIFSSPPLNFDTSFFR